MKFKPEDFAMIAGLGSPRHAMAAAEIANAKLQEWLDKSIIVCRIDGDRCAQWLYLSSIESLGFNVTHTAKLVCIEEIK